MARGEDVYEAVCRECHTLQPPPRLAPSLAEVARSVRSATEGRGAFTEHLVQYARAPSRERSLMSEETIRVFGLMPPQRVSESRLRDVAAFVWTLGDSVPAGESPGGGP